MEEGKSTGKMTHETAISTAKDIADRLLAPAVGQNNKEGRFSREAVEELGLAGLLGLMVPVEFGGLGLGPCTFAAVTTGLAEADPSVAMVYLMHVCATAMICAARPGAAVARILNEIAAGWHLSTLAFSESGSRSQFWSPVSRARRDGGPPDRGRKTPVLVAAGWRPGPNCVRVVETET
jgi:alkylation response protein AidB-like acyl-CoA dehydrogenase